MALQIIDGYPPNFHEIAKAFPAARNFGVVFTFGPVLYAPTYGRYGGVQIEPSLMAHEVVHSVRQAAHGDLNAWWRDYIADKEFRFAEELPAHQEEWRVIRETVPVRQQCRQHLKMIATRLSGSLYGNVVTFAEARRMIVGKVSD